MRTSILVRIVASLVVVAGAGCGSSPASPGGDAGPEETGTSADSGKRSGGDSGKSAADSGHDSSKPLGDSARDMDQFNLPEHVAPPPACTKTALAPTRGSAIALTPDDTHLVVVNRDVGTVTVMSIAYDSGTPSEPVLTEVAELPVGGEPWQVVVDACGATAYVVTRKDQKLVSITGIDTATPTVGDSVSVGSEPSSLALTPNNTALYVSNWVDGNLTVINPATMSVTSTIDLNATLAATGYLGPDVAAAGASRPGLAHPRGIAITNNGDTNDQDETVYVTEWFAVRTAPESLTPAPSTTVASVSDTNWKGLLYSVPVATGTPTTLDLPPVLNTGFADAKGNATGCFPNQVASVTINSGFAYVTSTCASPAGPTGVFQKGQCSIDAECIATNGSTANGAAGSCVNGACIGECVVGTGDATCGVGSAAGACIATGAGATSCSPLALNAKTTTHPAVTIVNLAGTPAATTTTLDTLFTTTSDLTISPPVASTRMPLLPVDIDFKNNAFAYVAAEGADALFRLSVPTAGTISQVGSADNDFIDMRTSADATVRLPIGVAVSPGHAFAFVANDGDRNVEAIDLNAQAVAVGPSGTDFRVLSSSALPTAAADVSILNGKRFFNTGLGRWSLNGAAWGSCGGCHVDGLSDNVTWYFARGPRQTVSLDGTFNSADPTDQRILNWTGIFDEVADFESNVRGISGGVGAIVSAVSTPPVNADRINLFTTTPVAQQGLEGSSADVANPASTSGTSAHSVIGNWGDINNYIASIRSPRSATSLVAADVTAGAALFNGDGNCVGCHGGGKWTISSAKFYTPGDTNNIGPNDAFGSSATTSLSLTTWVSPQTGTGQFPPALFPATTNQFMRSGAPPTFEQIQCVLRPVGTITANPGAVPTGVSPAAVNVLEVRQDMATGAQGGGGINANDFTRGYNPPSLLGLQVGAPYFHAGNARSLEELFTATFAGHHQSAITSVFAPTPTQIRQLVAFLLSIDESTPALTIPSLGSSGGDLCHYP